MGKGGVSTKLARYPHYNYERQSEYQIHLCAQLSNFEEIEVVKASPNYICGTFDNGLNENTTGNKPSSNSKTATFIMKSQKSTGESQADPRVLAADNDNYRHKRFYFKNPETGKYEGPLSLSPSGMDDLTAFRKINGVKVKHAYVRYETQRIDTDVADSRGTPAVTNRQAKTAEFTPLYKTADFKDNMDKPPKPADNCLLIFTLKVLNTFDKQKTSPQSYELNEKVAYRSQNADPANQKLLDSDEIEVNKSSKHVCYVYADHKELDTLENKDHANDAQIPAWHPHHLLPNHTDYATGFNLRTVDSSAATYPENKLGNGTERKVHPKAQAAGTVNIKFNDGVTNGQANRSIRYGDFKEPNAKDGVFLDFFVEHHGAIDQSGWNEVDYDAVFGQPVDYSANRKTFEYSHQIAANTGNKFGVTEKAGTDKRLHRLHEVVRHRRHVATDVSDSYYATARLKFATGRSAQEGETYKFSVVGVSNKLATHHDLSYNKNMVDWNKNFYPYLNNITKKSANDNTKVSLPQPFQKYVYDPSGERDVTYGYAHHNLGGDDDKSMITNNNTGYADNTRQTKFENANFMDGDKSVDASGTKGAIIRRIIEWDVPATAVTYDFPTCTTEALDRTADITGTGKFQVYIASTAITTNAELAAATLADNTATNHDANKTVFAFLLSDITARPEAGDYIKLRISGAESLTGGATT